MLALFVDFPLFVIALSKLSAVRESTESNWALSDTSMSQAERCPGKHWANCALSDTSLSQGDRCPRKQWVKLSAVRQITESSWALSGKALSQTERCPTHHWVRLSAVRLNSVPAVTQVTGSICMQRFSLFLGRCALGLESAAWGTYPPSFLSFFYSFFLSFLFQEIM